MARRPSARVEVVDRTIPTAGRRRLAPARVPALMERGQCSAPETPAIRAPCHGRGGALKRVAVPSTGLGRLARRPHVARPLAPAHVVAAPRAGPPCASPVASPRTALLVRGLLAAWRLTKSSPLPPLGASTCLLRR